MTVKDILRQAERLTRDNSSSILTALSVTGLVGTVYLTGKATFKAAFIISEGERIEAGPVETKDAIKAVWKLYIPAAVSGTITIGCILGSAKVNSKRTAALTAAYSLSEKAFSEYKDKVVETLGEKKEKKIREEIAEQHITQHPPTSSVVLAGTGDVLCCEMWTGRYFTSNMETLRKAQNDINAKLLREDEATASDFYDLIGIPNTTSSGYSGWRTPKMMELSFSTHLHEGKPCLAFEYNYILAF